MKGCNPSYFRSRVFAWAGVLLLGVMSGHLRGEGLGHEGQQGESVGRAEINFSDLAAVPDEGGATETGRRGRRQAAARRKTSTAPKGRPALSGSELKRVAASDTPPATASFTAAGGPSTVSPPPSASFQALPDNGVAFNPDTHGAVGPNHLMVTLASQVRVQSRTGASLLTVSLNTFWGTVGSSNVYDPRVLYDSTAQRWITTAIADPPGLNNASMLIGVSTTSDPTGSWHLRSVPVDAVSQIYPESPNVGFTRDWITVSAPMFSETNFLFFSSDLWVFNKTNLYAGGSGQFTYFRYENEFIGEDSALVPAVTLDPAYSTNFLVANWIGNDGVGAGFLRLFSIGGPVNAPVFEDYEPGVTFTNGLYAGLSATWESYPPTFDNFAPQQGTSSKIFIGDSRIQNVVFRNAALWCTHHIFLPTGPAPTRTSVQWFSMTPGGNITQTGRYDDGSGVNFYAYPSLAVNANEDVLIGFSRFAANRFPSANYSFASSENMILRSDAVLKAGENSFVLPDNRELTRWGDWSATVVDPVNDTDFWTIQEYAGSPGNDHWGTWWGRVAPPTDLTLAVTDSPDPVVAGANVTYSLRVTNNALTLATGVSISNTLPVGAQFVSAVSSAGGCTHNAGVVTCNLGDLIGQTNASATIVATLTQSPVATNTAVLFGFGPEEGLAADNTVKTTTAVTTSADISLLISALPNPVTVSNNLTYLVVVTNRGPSVATGVALTNTLPAGVTFVSAIPGAGQGTCSQSGGVVSCNLGAVGNNGSATVTIVVRPNAAGQITNRASVATTAGDPNLLNNTNSIVSRANAAPTMQLISDRTILEDGVLVVSFTVNDLETPATNLQVVASSSNQSIIPNANILIDNAGGSRVMTITPAPNANGLNTLITRIVTDADGASTTNSFVLNVTPDNDRPTISPISNVTTNEDSVVGPLSFAIGDVETPGSLTVSGSSSNPQLIPNANINISPTGSSRTVTLTPLANSNGTASITLTVSDGALSTNRVFTVTLNAVNDVPTISNIANRTNNEDTATGSISFTVGDVETAAGSLVPGRLSSNQTLVPTNNIVFGGSGQNRTVTVTPAANEFGTAVITVSISDANGGSTNDTFQFTVNPVNDPPTLDPIIPNPLNILEDAGLQVVTLNNITVGPSNEAQTNRITAASNNPGLILNLTTNYAPPSATATLSFTPAPNSNGLAVITVTMDDGGASNNFVVRTLNVNVAAVNDAPTISDITNRGTTEDVATGPIPFTVGDIDSSLASLSFIGRASDTNLVPNGNFQFNGSGSNWTVNITPAPNRFGTNTISILVSDGSATNSDSFILSVQSVNDLPTISPIGTNTINEDVTTNISFTIGDAETVAGSLNLSASSSNPALFSSITFGGSDSNRTINIVPASNQYGMADITVTVSDLDGGTNSRAFHLKVNEVNDLPTVDEIASVKVDEDAGQQTVLLSGISSGAPNENQTLSVTASSGSPAIVSNVQVAYTSAQLNGTLRYTPVSNANGVAVLTVAVSDGLATNSRTFNVNVSAINDLPVISTIGNQSINEDTTVSIPFTASDVETPPAQLIVEVTSSNSELLDETGISITGTGMNRNLVLTPLLDQPGSAASSTFITLTVRDADNDAAVASFELTVLPVNDLPTITGLTNVTILASAPNPVLPFTVSDPETIPIQLILTRFSSNQALVPTNNLIVAGTGVNRTLTVRPLAGQFGSTTIRLVVADANGGLATNSFVFTAVNDPPTLDLISPVTMNEDGGQRTVNLTGITSGSPSESQVVIVTAVSSNLALIPNPIVSYSNPNTTGTLTFTPLPNASGTSIITVTVDDQQANNNIFSRNFTVTVNAVNDAPTLAAIADRATLEDVPAVVDITVADVDTSLPSLVLFGLSSNTNLIPTNAMVFIGSTGSRTLTITPRPNLSGSSQLAVIVTDGAGGFATNSFGLSVLPTNDAPVISNIGDTNVNEDLQLTVAFTIGDPDNDAGVLELTAATSNGALLPVSRVDFGGGGSNRVVTVMPMANQTGSVTVTITATDPYGAAVSDSFVLTVNALNDPPTLSGLPDITISEDAATGPLTITVGDVDTPLANLNLSGSSGNIALVPNGNISVAGTGPSRTVTITPVANQSGSAVITLTLSDGAGGTTNTSFTLTVQAVNDPPTLDTISGRNLTEDAGLQTVNLTGISAGGGESQPLTVTANSSNPSVVSTVNVNYTSANATGTLTFTPVANANGFAAITVKVDDGQAQNSFVTRTFTVTVGATNDGPTISNIADQTMIEDTVLTVPFTIGDVETAGLSLSLSATSSNTTLVAVTNIQFSGAGTNRTVTVIPSPDQFGMTLITVRVTDGVATNSDSFLLTVNSTNDLPTLNPIANTNVTAAGGNPAFTVNLAGIGSGAANESQALSVTATANPALASAITVNYTGGNTGSLTIRPGSNGTGSWLITVTVSDGQTNTVRTFTFTSRQSNNVRPTISAISAQTLNEDTPSAAIPFTVGDAETAAASLTVVAVSTNQTVLPNSNIVLGGSGANRTITLTPAPNRFGSAAVWLTVTDGSFGSSNRTFNVTVNSSNDVPAISSIANQTIGEDTPTAALTFNVTDVETPAPNLVVTATSSSQTVIPNTNIVLGGSGTNRALVITPAANQSGSATITVNVSDGSATTNTQFTVTVNATNDPPTISDVADQTINEDTATAALAFTVGDAETAAGTLVPAASSSNTNLVPNTAFTFGGSVANRTVVVTPAPNQFGAATITLSVSDGTNQVSDTFVLTVNPTNDTPTLDTIGDRTIGQNSGPQSVNLTGISAGAPNENQALIVAASSSNAALIPSPSVNYDSPEATGTLSFQPVAGATGTVVITVVVNDGQAQNSSVTRTFNVTVTAAPVIAAVPNQVINEDRVGSPINFTVADADSTLSSVGVTASSSNPALVPNATLSPGGTGANRTLVITPAANEYGFTTITLTAQDNSGNLGSTTFLLTVAPVNDAPTINPIGNRILPPNAGLQIIDLSGISSGAANEAQALIVTATSGNPGLIPNPTVDYTSPGGTGTLMFTPAANGTGSVVITVKVMDDGGTALGGTNETSRQFTVAVGGVPLQLRIERIGANVVVSWPTNNAEGWTLRSGTSMANPSSWNAVVTQPSIVLGRHTVTNSASGAARYYRLCSGCSTGMQQDATLSIRRSSGSVVIDWPSSAGDFVLESTSSLSAPIDWAPVGNLPVDADGKFSVTVDVEVAPRFFRLRGR